MLVESSRSKHFVNPKPREIKGRNDNSCNEGEVKVLEHLCLYFYPVGSLSLSDEPLARYIYI